MRLAVGFGARVRGLLGAKRSKGIVMLAPCNDVHTFGMAELIDIAFLDEQGRVLESYRPLGRAGVSDAVKRWPFWSGSP